MSIELENETVTLKKSPGVPGCYICLLPDGTWTRLGAGAASAENIAAMRAAAEADGHPIPHVVNPAGTRWIGPLTKADWEP